MTRRALGRGLEALLPQLTAEPEERIQLVDLDLIAPCRHQPRRRMDEERLRELAESIREHGVVQPVVLRTAGDGFELVAGERRWRASRIAGLTSVPAVIKEFSDSEVMEVALIENLQREDLNPLEEAVAYRTLIDEHGLTQEELGRRIGKSRSHISNTMRLLTLDERIQGALGDGSLNMGHALLLLGLDDRSAQSRVAAEIEARRLSVRQSGELIKEMRRKRGRVAGPGVGRRDPALCDVEDRLREALGTKVIVRQRGERGRIEIEYYGHEDLNRLVSRLMNEEADPAGG